MSTEADRLNRLIAAFDTGVAQLQADAKHDIHINFEGDTNPTGRQINQDNHDELVFTDLANVREPHDPVAQDYAAYQAPNDDQIELHFQPTVQLPARPPPNYTPAPLSHGYQPDSRLSDQNLEIAGVSMEEPRPQQPIPASLGYKQRAATQKNKKKQNQQQTAERERIKMFQDEELGEVGEWMEKTAKQNEADEDDFREDPDFDGVFDEAAKPREHHPRPPPTINPVALVSEVPGYAPQPIKPGSVPFKQSKLRKQELVVNSLSQKAKMMSLMKGDERQVEAVPVQMPQIQEDSGNREQELPPVIHVHAEPVPSSPPQQESPEEHNYFLASATNEQSASVVDPNSFAIPVKIPDQIALTKIGRPVMISEEEKVAQDKNKMRVSIGPSSESYTPCTSLM
jgi:hypothetical protein